MQTPITEEKEVNEIYAVIKGDSSVGIEDDVIVLKGFFYLQPEEVENVRQRFADFVAYTWGERPQVQFDFEHQAEVEAEETSWAEQLEYERQMLLEAKPASSTPDTFAFMQVEDLGAFNARRTGLGF